MGVNSSSYLIVNEAINIFDFDEAYSHFDNLQNLDNENDLLNQLFILIHVYKIPEAKKTAEKILNINSYNQEAWIVNLIDAKIKGDLSEFIRLKKNINKSEMKLLNYIFFEDKQRDKIKSNKISARSIMEVVRNAILDNQENQNYEFILFYLSLANILDPNFNEAYFLSAQIYQELKYFNKAEELYKKISNNHKLYFDAQINVAIIKSKFGFLEEGVDILLRLDNDFPSNQKVKTVLGDLYRLEKKYEIAIIYYTEVLKNNKKLLSDSSQIFYMRGISFERSQNWDLAEKDFLRSLELNPDSPEVLNYLAYGWLERNKNIKVAIGMLKKALIKNPDSFYILDSLAWGYFKMNELQKASDLMEEVILKAPGEAISLYHLGDIYFAMKRKREAIFFWKQALDLAKPDDMITDILIDKLNLKNAG